MSNKNHLELREVTRMLLSSKYVNQEGVIEVLPLLIDERSSGKDVFEYLLNIERVHLDGFGFAFITQVLLSANPVAGRTFMEMLEFFYLSDKKEIKDRYNVTCRYLNQSSAVGSLLGALRVADNINTPANSFKRSHEEYEKIRDQIPSLLAAFVTGDVYAASATFHDRDNIFNEELELLLKRGAATYLADERRQKWMREFCRQTNGIVARNFEGKLSDSKWVYTNLFFGFAGSVCGVRKHNMLKTAIG